MRTMPRWLGGGGSSPSRNFTPAVDTSMNPTRRAFLDTLSIGESGGDYGAQNPLSSAHGRYQFINSTDTQVSAETNLPGQDPASQDRKAWYSRGEDLRAEHPRPEPRR